MKIRLAFVAGCVALSPILVHAQSGAPNADVSGPQHVTTSPAASPVTSQSPSPSAAARSAKKADRAADRAFAKKVRQAITKAPGIGGAQVTVFAKAKTGDVTLAGQITDQSQDQVAVDAARQVPGVTSVKSRLQLRLEGSQ
ncbi:MULTISPECIES: BON domain-containing protein [Burkholderia]|uniref:Transporter n=1 Tax=Burkholderia lata (strain ATCC 17760 / DSM 23089 / LMG 22485 / NCIMB 9086 / R18194 / 383) TaxID=482957 RepID=A0A6P2NPC3_BURL3|nr:MULTISPECIES: BON domain-containing protein [Burkholderia]MBN3773152.1 BON domain-containing protein [Burkholderia sp. Se-20378]MBN3798886.1 BON domain-containing protein [Burkholderia sp. Ac-20392]VWB96509.1 transporter [Burkholderia lata]VWM11141.1 transporter [Burkholderia lata]